MGLMNTNLLGGVNFGATPTTPSNTSSVWTNPNLFNPSAPAASTGGGWGSKVGKFLGSPGGAALLQGGMNLFGGALDDTPEQQLELQRQKMEQDKQTQAAQILMALLGQSNMPGQTAVKRDILANSRNVQAPAGLESYMPTGGARIPEGGFSQETLNYYDPKAQQAEMAKLRSYYNSQLAAAKGSNAATMGALNPAASTLTKTSNKKNWLGPVLGTAASIFSPALSGIFRK